jgi:hypothetical protein
MSLLRIEITSELELALRNHASDQGQELKVFILGVLKEAANRSKPLVPPRDREEEPAETPPAPSETSGEDNEDQAPWRGVFVVERHREPSTSTAVPLQLSNLPKWRPEVVVPRRWLDAGDE